MVNGDLDSRRRDNWKWIGGTPYNYNGLPGWNVLEPSNGEQFGAFRGNKWAAFERDLTKYPYICETSKLLSDGATFFFT